jgi:hypothetical protein
MAALAVAEIWECCKCAREIPQIFTRMCSNHELDRLRQLAASAGPRARTCWERCEVGNADLLQPRWHSIKGHLAVPKNCHEDASSHAGASFGEVCGD